MNGQADRLRARMQAAAAARGEPMRDARSEDRGAAALQRDSVVGTRLARTLAVASGKGGVGKSTLALGVAWAAAARGVRTALVDADLGLANLDILCGVQPTRTCADWLAGRAALADCFARIAPRLWLLPGASGVARMADLELPLRERLVGGLARVASHVDLLVVDLGAGLGAGTLDVATAADRLLVVCTPEPTAMADAYGFIKACARRGRSDGVSLAVNMARGDDEARHAADRVRSACARFLSMSPSVVGSVPADDEVRLSVAARVPLLAHAPGCAAARAIRAIEGRAHGVGVGESAPASAAEAPRGGFLETVARLLGVGAGSGVPRVASVQ